MNFDNLIYILEFLIKNPKLVDRYSKNSFLIIAHIYNNKLCISSDSISYNSSKYFITYDNISQLVEVIGNSNKNKFNNLCNELFNTVNNYSKEKLLNDIKNYENLSNNTSSY